MIMGKGKDYVAVEVFDATPSRQALRLTAVDAHSTDSLDLELSVLYENGQKKVRQFSVLPDSSLNSIDGGIRRLSYGISVHQRQRKLWTPWEEHWAGKHEDQCLYEQIRSGDCPNYSACWSGCGATAWTLLIGWADRQAAIPNSGWEQHEGLYRKDGGYGENVIAPVEMDGCVKNITMGIMNYMGTACTPDGMGATAPWSMAEAVYYFADRAEVGWTVDYNILGLHTDSIRNKAWDIIKYHKTPVIIGTGWFYHYPLA